jgi:hypothetical protein
MFDRSLIDPTTSAATKSFKAACVGSNFCQIYVTGSLGATEEIGLEQPDGSGGWTQITYDGDDVKLNTDNLRYTINGCGRFRINKDTTTNAVGVSISRV